MTHSAHQSFSVPHSLSLLFSLPSGAQFERKGTHTESVKVVSSHSSSVGIQGKKKRGGGGDFQPQAQVHESDGITKLMPRRRWVFWPSGRMTKPLVSMPCCAMPRKLYVLTLTPDSRCHPIRIHLPLSPLPPLFLAAAFLPTPVAKRPSSLPGIYHVDRADSCHAIRQPSPNPAMQ